MNNFGLTGTFWDRRKGEDWRWGRGGRMSALFGLYPSNPNHTREGRRLTCLLDPILRRGRTKYEINLWHDSRLAHELNPN